MQNLIKLAAKKAGIRESKQGDCHMRFICTPVRIQACMLVRLKVMPVFTRVTGSVMRQWLMGQKNSGGGAVAPLEL